MVDLREAPSAAHVEMVSLCQTRAQRIELLMFRGSKMVGNVSTAKLEKAVADYGRAVNLLRDLTDGSLKASNR